MTTDNATEKKATGEALRALLKAGKFDAEAAALAEKCLKTLERKPRVAVLGPAVDYGTDTVNFLSGVRLLGPESGETFVQLLHGTSTKATAALEGSERQTFMDADIPKAFENDPKVVQIRADAAPLTKVDVVRGVSASPSKLTNMMKWVGKDTDILLWCSTDFSDDEEGFWNSLPDALRGKALLLLPCGKKRNETIRERGEGVFGRVIELNPAEADAARSHSSGVNREAFAAAGGSDFVKVIKQEIERFERAALDAGKIILMRHGQGDASSAETIEPVEEVAPEPAVETELVKQSAKVVSIDRTPTRPISETPAPAAEGDPRDAIFGIFHRRAGTLDTSDAGHSAGRSAEFLDGMRADIQKAMKILESHDFSQSINADFAKRMMKEADERLSEIPPDEASAPQEGAGILTQLQRDLGFVLSS